MKKRFYLMLAFIASLFTLTITSAHAEGESLGIDPSMIKSTVDSIGLPALIGACVAAMLAIAVLIWGGKKIISFFTK